MNGYSLIDDDMGFKVAGHLRHVGATPSPPAGNVCKHSGNTMAP